MAPHERHQHADSKRHMAGFWAMGLLNNAAYVVMIAGANEISSGSIGIVYLCAVLPSLLVKVSCPHWFHLVRYELRVWMVAVLMSLAYITVGLSNNRAVQLLGVALGSVQSGLGEASCLALCTLFEPQRALTFWSSGTGFAGVSGYAWVNVLHIWFGFSFRFVLLAANASSIIWLWCYYGLLDQQQQQLNKSAYLHLADDDEAAEAAPDVEAAAALDSRQPLQQPLPGCVTATTRAISLASSQGSGGSTAISFDSSSGSDSHDAAGQPGKDGKQLQLSWQRRLVVTGQLWPYMVPLTTVYAAEYAMQSGTWTAIGFPVTSAGARNLFYSYSNWMYQAGVFLSRSSGMLFQANRKQLWVMPVVQCLLLAFFSVVGVYHWPLYNMMLLIPAFMAGLLGGAVYVNAFTLMSREVEPALREFALAAASVSDSLGVAFADFAGVLIQGCIFRVNGLPGADFKCGA